jgi:hypothetical protein
MPLVRLSVQQSGTRTRTRTNTNPNDTEANAAGRSPDGFVGANRSSLFYQHIYLTLSQSAGIVS